MDIAAGAAGFLSLIIQLTEILTAYISTAKSTEQDAKDILREAECLKDVLEHFEKFVEAEKLQEKFRAGSALCGIIDLSNSKVKGLVDKLPKVQGSKSKQLFRSLIWPFKKPDCIEIVGTLQRCIQILNFSMNTQSLFVIHLSPKYSFPFLTIADKHVQVSFYRRLRRK